MRETVALVAWRFQCALEPRDGLVQPVFFHQVGADVVVRIAECGIYLDGSQAFLNGLVPATLEAVGPTEKCVAFGSREDVNRTLVELDGLLQIALHLVLIGLLKERHRLFALQLFTFRGHRDLWLIIHRPRYDRHSWLCNKTDHPCCAPTTRIFNSRLSPALFDCPAPRPYANLLP